MAIPWLSLLMGYNDERPAHSQEENMAATFVDFAIVKETVTVEKAIGFLGLTMRRTGDQLRGPCPACKGGGDRALAVNIPKNSYYCFAEGKGGDVIAFTAHIRDLSQRDAALLLSTSFGNDEQQSAAPVPNRPPSPQGGQPEKRGLQPLTYLEDEHEHVQALGISPETARAWGAGYAPRGIMRGRFAVPVHGMDGTLLAYVGIAVTEEQSPKLLYPNGFDPGSVIFGAEKVGAGELYLVRSPLQVLAAAEQGMENVVAFLAPITAQSLVMLAALCDEAKIETVELF